MLLETIERETGADPTWSVIWLHGLGADGNDFVPLVPELVQPDWPATRFVFPHAPVRPVTINNGMRMRAWYDIAELDLANRADEQGVAESIVQVEALIAREAERGIAASHVVLAGFSQGGAIALSTGLRRSEPLGGLVALSTYLPALAKAQAVLRPEAVSQPVFMAHGGHDPVVPLMAGEQSARVLSSFGFDVEWRTYPMPHSLCAQEVLDLRAWFAKRFASA